MKTRKFILHYSRAPGDVLMLSGLIRDLKYHYGDSCLVDVRNKFPAIWRHNPHLTKLEDRDPTVEHIKLSELESMKLSKKGQRLHFATAFHREFERRTKIPVPCLYSKPDLHLSEEEKRSPYIEGRYWIVIPGGKIDMTNKFWSQQRYQDTVDTLRTWGLRFVEEGATKNLCSHPPLDNTLNVVGLTSIRDLILNIYHAEGVICGVTFPMHIAAALDKPCVVIAGGREEPWWEAYVQEFGAFGPQAAPPKVPHRYLHTLGLLSCCATSGCWNRRVLPLGDGLRDNSGLYDNSLCTQPVHKTGLQTLPQCMNLITTDMVVNAALSYYYDFTLPPLPGTEVEREVREIRRQLMEAVE